MNKKIIPITIAAVVLLAVIVIFTKFFFQQDSIQECGDKNRERFSNFELSNAFKSAKNNLQVSNDKFPTSNIIDGQKDSRGYPNSKQLDYTVDLVDLYDVKKITLIWNRYGERENYVSNWTIEGCNENGEWSILGQGQRPNSKKSILDINKQAVSAIRLRADSKKDWIGIYEIIIE